MTKEITITKCPYSYKDSAIKHGGDCWNSTLVEIFEDDKKIGEYNRNYRMLHTFHPFQQDGKWYALYSENYTATLVMELPSCKKIAGEEPCQWGFCPVDYYVPKDDDLLNCEMADGEPKIEVSKKTGHVGFMSGCVWGDDSSYKVRFIDLSKIMEGILKIDDRFGYVELPREHERLKDCLNFEFYEDLSPSVEISISKFFNMETGKCDGDD